MSNPYRSPTSTEDDAHLDTRVYQVLSREHHAQVAQALQSLQWSFAIGGSVMLVTVLGPATPWFANPSAVAIALATFLICAGAGMVMANVQMRRLTGLRGQQMLGHVAIVLLGISLGAMTALTFVIAGGRPIIGLRALFAATVVAMFLTGASLTLIRLNVVLRIHGVTAGVSWMNGAVVFFAIAGVAISMHALRWQFRGSEKLLFSSLVSLVLAFTLGVYGLREASASLPEPSSSTD